MNPQKNNSTPYAIEVADLTKSFNGHRILNGISFTVTKREIVGIVGKSGAGKSTLFRCLNALESPDDGKIIIEGKGLTASNSIEILQKVGTIFQNFNLLHRRTVLENIFLPFEIQNKARAESIEKAKELAAMVGLEQKMNAYPSQLSGGQKQRVAIARALATQGALLLCDEFTSALDPITTLEILSLLKKLNRQLGLTILLISHDMSVVREICDHVIILDHGKIIEKDTIEEIILRPKSAITKTLLKSIINHELPDHLHKNLHAKPFEGCDVVLRLLFSGGAVHHPVVATLINQFNVPVNIIAGNLGHIREQAVGALIITLPFEYQKLQSIREFLQTCDVAIDELGYGKWA